MEALFPPTEIVFPTVGTSPIPVSLLKAFAILLFPPASGALRAQAPVNHLAFAAHPSFTRAGGSGHFNRS